MAFLLFDGGQQRASNTWANLSRQQRALLDGVLNSLFGSDGMLHVEEVAPWLDTCYQQISIISIMTKKMKFSQKRDSSQLCLGIISDCLALSFLTGTGTVRFKTIPHRDICLHARPISRTPEIRPRLQPAPNIPRGNGILRQPEALICMFGTGPPGSPASVICHLKGGVPHVSHSPVTEHKYEALNFRIQRDFPRGALARRQARWGSSRAGVRLRRGLFAVEMFLLRDGSVRAVEALRRPRACMPGVGIVLLQLARSDRLAGGASANTAPRTTSRIAWIKTNLTTPPRRALSVACWCAREIGCACGVPGVFCILLRWIRCLAPFRFFLWVW
jgi:hypothetical protein